jgi:hypothetical protein
LVEKWISSVFSGSNWTFCCVALVNNCIARSRSWLQFFVADVEDTEILKSSIYDNCRPVFCIISRTYSRNNIGDTGDPCGIPSSTFVSG